MVLFIMTLFTTLQSIAYNDRSKSLIRKYLYVKNTKVTILFVAMLISIDYMVR